MAYRYNRINWQDKPSTATPISAANLNKMDKGIDDNDKAIGDLVQLNTLNKSSLVSAVNELNNNLANYSEFEISAKSSITLRLSAFTIYLLGTVHHLGTNRSACIVFGGNDTNASQKATIHNIVNGTGITYNILNETGKYNDIKISNTSDYRAVLKVLTLGNTTSMPIIVN